LPILKPLARNKTVASLNFMARVYNLVQCLSSHLIEECMLISEYNTQITHNEIRNRISEKPKFPV